MSRKRRVSNSTVEEALRDPDPLMSIETLIDEESVGGKWFRLMFAAILEVNSAGPGILLDRYTFEEIRFIASEYERMGAAGFSSALRELLEFAASRFGSCPTEDQMFALSEDPEFESLDRLHTLKFESYRDEMERCLLKYIASHPDEIKKA